METKNVYIVTTMQNNGLDFKNTPGYIKYTNAQKKSPFYENVLDFTSFSQNLEHFFLFVTLIPVILFLETLFQENKSQESKTQDFIFSDILIQDFRKLGLFYQRFYFQVFFN